MNAKILIPIALLAVSVFLFGCVQPEPDDKGIPPGLEVQGTGSSASDVTAENVSELSASIDATADVIEGFEDIEIEDSGIDETTFQ